MEQLAVRGARSLRRSVGLVNECVCVGVMLRDSKPPRGISPGQPHYPVGVGVGGGGLQGCPRAATVSAWKKFARGEYSFHSKSTARSWIVNLLYNVKV